jgi:hypothetical protein
MTAPWKTLGCGLLIVALSGGFAGCGDDDDDDDEAGSGGSSSAGKGGTSGSGTAGKGGASGSGTAGKGGAGGAGGQCGTAGPLSATCVSCVQSAVTACGTECVALLNCSANKCATATTEAAQTACVTMCCIAEAGSAIAAPGGRDALIAAQKAQRAECAAMCASGDMDGGS